MGHESTGEGQVVTPSLKSWRQTKKDLVTVALDMVREGESRVMEATLALTETMHIEDALADLAPFPVAKVGDILMSSWGYDQTNIDYYQVVKATASSVWLREVRKQVVSRTAYDDSVAPCINSFTEVKAHVHKIKRAYRNEGYSVSLGKYRGGTSAWLWDGEARRQTGAGYGH